MDDNSIEANQPRIQPKARATISHLHVPVTTESKGEALKTATTLLLTFVCVVMFTSCGTDSTVSDSGSPDSGSSTAASDSSHAETDAEEPASTEPGDRNPSPASALLNAELPPQNASQLPSRNTPSSPTPTDDQFANQPLPENELSDGAIRLMQTPLLAEFGLKASKGGSHAQATRYYTELLQRIPDNIEIMMTLADNHFMACQIDEAIVAYDMVIANDPRREPYLWQRGLALYYAKRFEEGVSQFEKHWVVNRNDVENSVWHMLCGAQVIGVEAARGKLIDIKGDTRVPMTEILKMYADKMTPEEVRQVATKPTSSPFRSKLQRYYGNLYIGLYQEMIGDHEASRASMLRAKAETILEKDILMSQVANIHLTIRDREKKAQDK